MPSLNGLVDHDHQHDIRYVEKEKEDSAQPAVFTSVLYSVCRNRAEQAYSMQDGRSVQAKSNLFVQRITQCNMEAKKLDFEYGTANRQVGQPAT